jgi:hypothetical protein
MAEERTSRLKDVAVETLKNKQKTKGIENWRK